MDSSLVAIGPQDTTDLIHRVRGQSVMLDSDLARLFGVETGALNQAVTRNIERFPERYRFQLTSLERDNLKSQFVTSSSWGGRRKLPWVFTEHGVAMLSAVLRSPAAVQTSIQVIDAFVAMRRDLAVGGGLIRRMDSLEQRQLTHERETDDRFEEILAALEARPAGPREGIFFDGQIFDAYVFVSDLLRSAQRSIVLIDNFIDESVLLQLTKRHEGVEAVILTRTITAVLRHDLERHNRQYPPISVRTFADSHDRFLILDGEEVYHLGASLKDLGKRWFAFSRLDAAGLVVMDRVRAILAD